MHLPIYGVAASSRESARQNKIAAGVAFFVLVGITLLSFFLISPPAPVPTSAPATDFSSARAMQHLHEIAVDIHPIGSAAHQRVRNYLLQELTALGLDGAHIQSTTAINGGNPPFTAGAIHNVVGRLKGTAGLGKAVVLLAHYDSVTAGFGAGDTGMGVAAILETVRALQAGPPLKNDVIVLFTDSEEYAMLGARAYLEEHPWAKDTGVVFNFEGQGPQGPVLVFETSPENGVLVNEIRRAVPNLITTSLAYDVYKLLPHYNDFGLFSDQGYAGLTTVILGDKALYHTTFDNVERVDERALQHQGVYSLSLARHFGNLNLPVEKAPNAIFFNLFGWHVVQYSAQAALIFAALLLVVFVGLLAAGRNLLTVKGTLGAATALMGALVVSGGIVWLIQKQFQVGSEDHRAGLFFLGFSAVAAGVTFLVFHSSRRLISRADLLSGVSAVWVGLAVVTSVYLPSGSYLFVWPALFMQPVLAFLIFGHSPRGYGNGLLAVTAVSVVPVIAMLAPTLSLLFNGIGLDMVVAPVVLVVLALALVMPFVRYVTDLVGWWLVGGAILIAVGLIATGVIGGVDAEHPQRYDVSYSLNSDQDRAGWVSIYLSSSPWVDQFFPPGSTFVPARNHFPVMSSQSRALYYPAPVLELPSPWVEVIEDREEGIFRILQIRVGSTRQAPYIALRATAAPPIVEAKLNGKAIPWEKSAGSSFSLRFLGAPEEGILIELKLGGTSPLQLQVVDQSPGLPKALDLEAPPNHLVPEPRGFDKNSTLVGRTFQL